MYNSIKLWFYTANDTDQNFLEFVSMPSTYYSEYLMIVGHNRIVQKYLTSHDFPETSVVAITCDGACNYKKLHLPGKKLYIPFQNKNNLVDLLSGRDYGFDFDITESEINFYNAPAMMAFEKRIEESFLPIEKYKRN